MRFDSKSLLSTIPMGPLEFECRNIAARLHANHSWEEMPIDYLGGGCFGMAFALRNFPGLVLKVCTRDDDAYPVFIRYIAAMEKPPAWAPRVFAHGGDERKDVFWCVIPVYEQIHGTGTAADRHWCHYSEAIRHASRNCRQKESWPRYVKRDHRSMRKVLGHIAELTGHTDDDGSFYADNHDGNSMWDPVRRRMVFADPFGYTSKERKESMPYYANL